MPDHRPPGAPDRIGNASGLEFSVVPQHPNLTRVEYIKGSDAPFELFEDMRLAVAQIHKSKLFLRELGIMVADSLNDDLPPFSHPPLRVTEEPTPASIQAATSMELQPVVNGDLGFGLTIGGVHEGAELLALACPGSLPSSC